MQNKSNYITSYHLLNVYDYGNQKRREYKKNLYMSRWVMCRNIIQKLYNQCIDIQ
ncbi:unnamed protein product [Paramecium octaurelia]|uniref:Uncharacterized protein n=1 Tax=Paramecium octaurelia TaxID=43137 RepID=A0A8S1UE51_PAROT|nr:unnamed protein product [Paramecium octaurelia]